MCLLQWLGAGGLLAFTQADTHDIYMFNLEDPAKPQYSHGYTSSSGSCMDEFIAHREGGFVVTSMCGRDGESACPVAARFPGVRLLLCLSVTAQPKLCQHQHLLSPPAFPSRLTHIHVWLTLPQLGLP